MDFAPPLCLSLDWSVFAPDSSVENAFLFPSLTNSYTVGSPCASSGVKTSTPSALNSFGSDSVNIEYAKNLIAQRYAKLQERCKEEGIKAPGKSLDGMITAAKGELGIPPDVAISMNTILSRIRRKRTVNVVPHAGTSSPMLKVEPILVQLCIQIGRIGQPVKPDNFLALANSLIKGKEIEKEVIKFKAKHCGYDINSESANLGQAYFRGFMNRNQHLIDLKRGKKYPKDRSEWTT